MIAHTSLTVRDYPKAKAFYVQALSPLGYSNNMEYGEAAGFNDGENTDFWISGAESVVPTHVAFRAHSRQQVACASTQPPWRLAARTTGLPAIATTHRAITPPLSSTRMATTSKLSGMTPARRSEAGAVRFSLPGSWHDSADTGCRSATD